MGGMISYKGRELLSCSCRKDNAKSDQFDLTDREKELVRTTWTRMAEKSDEVSVDIFLRIFERIPQAKQFFPFKNAAGEALLKHPYFKGHAMRFFNAVRMTVTNLDAWEIVLIPNLIKLGQQHADIQGFQHDYFDVFRKAMIEVFEKHLGRAYTSETRTAWNKIFSLITAKVEQGYLEGQEMRARERDQAKRTGRDADLSNSKAESRTCPLSEKNASGDRESRTLASTPEADRRPDGDAKRESCPPPNGVTSTDNSAPNGPCSSDEGRRASRGEENAAKPSRPHINNNGTLEGGRPPVPPHDNTTAASDLGNTL